MEDKITVRCTNSSCGVKFRAPRSFLGKMVACKACGNRQKVEEHDESSERASKPAALPSSVVGWSNAPSASLKYGDEPEEDSYRGGGLEFEDLPDSRAPVLTGRTAEGIVRDTLRYPSLHKYLGLLKAVQKILLIIGQVAAVIVTLAGLIVAISNLATSYRHPQFENNVTNLLLLFAEFLLEFGAAALLGGIIWLITYLGYLVSMAGIEIVYVLIDIEQHTRISRAHIEREGQRAG